MKSCNRVLAVFYLLLQAGVTYADFPSPKAKEHKDEKNQWGANLIFVTDYISRGLTQTERSPALQADLIYNLPYNFHLNFFASNVHFSESSTRIELDTGIGYTLPLNNDNELNLIYLRYTYPKDRSFNYNELCFTATSGPLSLQGAYSLNMNNSHHRGLYLAAIAAHEFSTSTFFGFSGVQSKLTIGHYWLPKQAGQSFTQLEGGFEKDINPMTYALVFSTTYPKQEQQHIIISAQYHFAG
jgi:uncharacterized protein (TIGR02001 family)